MKWIEIKRDKDGFATEECLNEMFKNDSIVVTDCEYDRCYLRYIVGHENGEWQNKIRKNEKYTHYLPIPLL